MGSATVLPVLRPEEPAVESTVYDRDACHQQSPGDQAGVSLLGREVAQSNLVETVSPDSTLSQVPWPVKAYVRGQQGQAPGILPLRSPDSRLPLSPDSRTHRLGPWSLNRGLRWRLLCRRGWALLPECVRSPPRSVELIPGKFVLLGSTWMEPMSWSKTLFCTLLARVADTKAWGS